MRNRGGDVCWLVSRRAISTWWSIGNSAGTWRAIHKGHVSKTLEKLELLRHQWLKEVDQAPEKSTIRRQKDKYIRELDMVRGSIQGLFRNDETAQEAVKPMSKTEITSQAKSKQRQEDSNEALRMYRLLRPDAPPFYEEDAIHSMQAKMHKVLIEETPAGALVPGPDKYGDPFKAYLPVVNQRAFLLALESVVASLADDVETVCLLAGLGEDMLPAENDPLRFKKLIDALFVGFPLRKDPSRVDEFMEHSWPRLRNFLPEEVAQIPAGEVADWLRGHLTRVRLNQRLNHPTIFLHQSQRFGDEEWYSFAEDFPYDDDPMPADLADERNLDFPLERAEEYMRLLLAAVRKSPIASDSAYAMTAGDSKDAGDPAVQFQEFVWDLERIGLRNWLRMDIRDLERFLPKGALAELSLREDAGEGSISLSQDDVEVAKLMLRCAARDRANLLDFEAVDPYKLLHGLPGREIDEELLALPPNKHFEDKELERLVDIHTMRLQQRAAAPAKVSTDRAWLAEGATVDELYKKELDFYRTAGPVEWQDHDGEYKWKWRQPPNTFWDERRKVYIQEQKGVDPNLQLKEMRQHMLDITRMGSMVKVGRINYFRTVVVVGNGKGVYGFGIGFGNTAKEARADGSLKALQNLDYIDMDPGRMLCTPAKGAEYKHTCEIIPRPIGRGIRANKKFLPLLYILGLDNCKVRFQHGKWFTRIKAIKRALDMMISRRTLANMTGKRYALLVAPGDHWVHWPDRWFQAIREPYDKKAIHIRLMRRHALHFKKRGNTTAIDKEVQPGWRKSNWARWNNSLERWLQYRRGLYHKGEGASSTTSNESADSQSVTSEGR